MWCYLCMPASAGGQGGGGAGAPLLGVEDGSALHPPPRPPPPPPPRFPVCTSTAPSSSPTCWVCPSSSSPRLRRGAARVRVEVAAHCGRLYRPAATTPRTAHCGMLFCPAATMPSTFQPSSSLPPILSAPGHRARDVWGAQDQPLVDATVVHRPAGVGGVGRHAGRQSPPRPAAPPASRRLHARRLGVVRPRHRCPGAGHIRRLGRQGPGGPGAPAGGPHLCLCRGHRR